MKINFQEIYIQIAEQEVGTQKRINIDSALGIFVGFNWDGNLRMSFLSSCSCSRLESTKLLRVIQTMEKKNSHWISFELLDKSANSEFFTFCENMIETVYKVHDEKEALIKLKRRYHSWRTLFQKSNDKKLPKELIQGVFGELYYLLNYLIPFYGSRAAINSWGGPEAQAKDFTIEETWYEIKTIGSTVDRIHVSSISQLDSEKEGHLVIVRVESVSVEYETGNCKLSHLITEILKTIDDTATETVFVEKLLAIGIDIFTCAKYGGFRLVELNSYCVNYAFPRICRKDILRNEIIGIQYDLSLASIHQYKEV